MQEQVLKAKKNGSLSLPFFFPHGKDEVKSHESLSTSCSSQTKLDAKRKSLLRR